MNLIERIFALMILIIISPILLIISIFIKIESHGNIIFKQKRVGKNGKEFNIYKFRSMKLNAPNVPTNDLNDPDRFITKIGKILRVTSLDELPQLFNIIKGDMSFVGPRPVLKDEIELNELREKWGVFTVRPGITGWAQINGRDELNNYEKALYDKHYVENKSMLLDVKILLLTVIKVLRKDDIREVNNNTGKVK